MSRTIIVSPKSCRSHPLATQPVVTYTQTARRSFVSPAKTSKMKEKNAKYQRPDRQAKKSIKSSLGKIKRHRRKWKPNKKIPQLALPKTRHNGSHSFLALTVVRTPRIHTYAIHAEEAESFFPTGRKYIYKMLCFSMCSCGSHSFIR